MRDDKYHVVHVLMALEKGKAKDGDELNRKSMTKLSLKWVFIEETTMTKEARVKSAYTEVKCAFVIWCVCSLKRVVESESDLHWRPAKKE